MGNYFAKDSQSDELTDVEKTFVRNAFRVICQDKDVMQPDELIEAWSYLVDPAFVHAIKDGCFRESNYASISIESFAKTFFIIIKGSMHKKAVFIATRIFDNIEKNPQGVVSAKILDFVSATVWSYFKILRQNMSREYLSWINRGVVVDLGDVKMYSEYTMKELITHPRVSIDQIEKWLYQQPLFLQIWKELMIYLYGHMNSITLPVDYGPKTLPLCYMPDGHRRLESILSIGKVMFINSVIPTKFRREWVLLYNSNVDGKSFSRLISQITEMGPTVILIKDEGNYLFGGFAPNSWKVGSSYRGDLTASLFTLNPNMNYFMASGSNNHFQYLNTKQQTMPNGLGMGGQHDYWGLWVDDQLATGHTSETCSTFAEYTQMSAQKTFEVRHIEVWSVKEPEDYYRISTFTGPQ